MEQSTTSGSQFKLSATFCGACDVRFDNPDARREHSKSQWHVTNLKRRMADLKPLTAEQHAAVVASTRSAPARPTTTEWPGPEDSSSSVSDGESSSSDTEPDFIPEDCLFCNATSLTFGENVSHMHKSHGLFIPDTERLVVDLETLVRYLHLVVFSYRECICCGTQRRTALAVQQHMRGKNHCRFDVYAPGSEYRDFYDFDYEEKEEKKKTKVVSVADASEDDDDGDEDEDGRVKEKDMGEEGSRARKAVADAIEEGPGSSIRLPSGKTLSHRSAPAPHRPGRRKLGEPSSGTKQLLTEAAGPPPEIAAHEPKACTEEEDTGASKAAGGEATATALTRAEKREAGFVETQLSRLSISDRNALAHLPGAEQRSLLLTQKKQVQKAERAARRSQMRLQMKANKAGQGHFVDDVMGARFMVGLYG